MLAKKAVRRKRIKRSIRAKINGTNDLPRLSVYRSNKDIYAQLIDDVNGNTLITASSKEVKAKGTKTDVSKEVGLLVAKKAGDAGIKTVVFDRGGYLYHGRVKALADGAREGGLKL